MQNLDVILSYVVQTSSNMSSSVCRIWHRCDNIFGESKQNLDLKNWTITERPLIMTLNQLYNIFTDLTSNTDNMGNC